MSRKVNGKPSPFPPPDASFGSTGKTPYITRKAPMNCKEFAELLLKTPTALFLMKLGSDWVEVCGVEATGVHRNAVTASVQNPALGGGVIVVEPDRFDHTDRSTGSQS